MTLRWYRSPLLHFLVLGTALFVAQRAWQPTPVPQIRVSADRIAALTADWQRRHAGRLTPAGLRVLVDREIEEALLLARAHALGLSEQSPQIEQMLVDAMRYAGLESGSDRERLRRAEQLGLAESDPMVRRYLIETVRHLWRQVDTPPARRVQDVARRLAAEDDEVLYTFELLHFRSQAEAWAARVGPLEIDTEQWADIGTHLPIGRAFSTLSVQAATALLGPLVSDLLPELEPHQWSQPVASVWGWHLLRVRSAEAAAVHPQRYLAPARRRVRQRMAEEAYATTLAAFRARYAIHVEWPQTADSGS